MMERERAHMSKGHEAFSQRFEDRWVGRFLATVDGRVVEASPAMAELLGLTDPQALCGRELAELCADVPPVHRLFTTVRGVGRAAVADLPLIRADGEMIRVALALEAVFDAEGQFSKVRGLAFEVSESVETRQRVNGAQRMEALGRLAGGIAHEFNNLLTVITGHGDRLVESLNQDVALARSASAIVRSAHRASVLTQQLLAFSRRQVFRPRVVRLDEVISDVSPLIVGVLGETVDLRLHLAPDLPSINVDPAQISQVLVHLAAYAREAMPGGGSLTLNVLGIAADTRNMGIRPWIRPGSYVKVSVTDTGDGLDAAAQAHIFEPFFSSRHQGVGGGLGLASIYGIVKQSGGYIWVESEVGRGTTFTLLFPAGGSATVSGASPSDAVPGEATILVVEDDESVRVLIADELRRRGYRVLESASGDEARDLFAGYSSRIHLLVTDVVLHSGSGPTLASRLRTLEPTLQVLYMTGLPGSVSAEDHPPGEVWVIQKPFSLQALADKVRAVLDRRASQD